MKKVGRRSKKQEDNAASRCWRVKMRVWEGRKRPISSAYKEYRAGEEIIDRFWTVAGRVFTVERLKIRSQV